jgi:RimJ/RimL family protein N-acetyltransferase
MRKIRLRSDVTIGPLEPEHAANMLAWMQNPQVSANIGLTKVASMEKTLAWIEEALRSTTTWPFAIFLNSRHVGNVVLDQADFYLGCARLSAYIGASEARASGVGLTGMYYALREGFFERGLHKVWLTVHVRNTPAIRSYTTLGFQVEGVLRDGFLLHGERLPVLYMGLLQEEFRRTETEQS